VAQAGAGHIDLDLTVLLEVVRCALQDAASVAGLLITTEAMVAELPKKESPVPAMPGGGMGGMDY
jgi:chaperonin GroEL